MLCAVPDCGKLASATIYCQMHYRRKRLYGDPLKVKEVQRRKSDKTEYTILGEDTEVMLANGRTALISTIDLELVVAHKWNVSVSTGYAYSGTAGTSMQQLIVGKAPAGMLIDHDNRNKLDNRRGNILFKTVSQNNFNSDRSDNAKTAHFHKASGKYRALVTVNGLQIHLGLFETEAEATAVYLKAKQLARECKTREQFKTTWKTMRLGKTDTEKRDE